MLVLSRKVGETIHIGDNVIIRVTRVQGNRVTLGIDAPPEVSIQRGELELELAIASDTAAETVTFKSTHRRTAIAG